MESVKTLFLYLGVCLSAGVITAAGDELGHRAENVRWVSLDFKTVLTWTTRASQLIYTVQYSGVDDGNWEDCDICSQVSETECDLSNYLVPYDRTYSANVLTDQGDDIENSPHTYSPHFNPYRESNISAPTYTVEAADGGRVMVNITDPLTSYHEKRKQLSIRDVLKSDLKYKITYYKSGNTRKREFISDSSVAELKQLDAGESYCFMVAAYIPSRPKATQQGAWSKQLCTEVDLPILKELSLGAWVGIVFILLTVLIIIIIVTVLCCRCCQRRKTLHTTQSSTPI
ncbi:tissue factor-like [Seriola dumerili]|uniref:Tissue factor n=1 Tax=Seriola dumerili TaxID=41447 RepID=A0A3B4THD5_SERDU|nr:tissue factor-like [Seriola dumerili]